MTRFVRIIPDPDPRADPGSRIRVDYDPDDTGAFVELGRDTARSLRDALVDLCKHLDAEDATREVGRTILDAIQEVKLVVRGAKP